MESTALAGTALHQTAQRLQESARENKRLERAHRRAAQRDRQALAELLEFAAANGIRIVIESKPEGTDK